MWAYVDDDDPEPCPGCVAARDVEQLHMHRRQRLQLGPAGLGYRQLYGDVEYWVAMMEWRWLPVRL